MVGVNSAWGDGITPDLEICFRTNSGNTGWDSGYPKASASNAQFECNANGGIFVLQRYTINDLMKTKSITLRIVNGTGSGGDALAIWAVPTANLPIDWTSSTAVATIVSAYTSVVGVAPRATTGSINSTYLVNGTDSKTDGNKFTITGAALTRLKNAAEGNTVTLLLTNKTEQLLSNTSRKFASSGDATEANKPTVTVTESFTNAVLLSKDDGAESEYDNIGTAWTEAANATSAATITVLQDQSISSRIEAISGKTLNIVPGKDGVIITNTANALTFLANANVAGTINVGKAGHSLVLKNTSSLTNNVIETSGTADAAANAIVNIDNVIFKDISTSNASGIVKANDNKGKISLKNVTFDGCTVSVDNAGLVYCNSNDIISIKGSLTFTNCTGNDFKLKGRINEDGFTPSKVYTIYSDGIALGQSAVTKMTPSNRNYYILTNADRCVVGKGNSSNEEMVVSEAYTLSVTAANAATLVIPFATTIPDGASCYTLAYSSGANITATPVATTLGANTPVLVLATGSAEGTKYKFNASARATSDTAASTSVDEANRTNGVLVGNYTADYVVPANNYILTKHDDVVAFRKANGTTNKVNAYRAYLTASYSASAPEFLFINFGGSETTAIDAVEQTTLKDDGAVYNLQGVRMTGSNLKKGIYVKNGKKFIVK